MFKNKTLIVIVVLILALLIGIVAGIFIFLNSSDGEKAKDIPTYTVVSDDLYGNIKDSKKILKLNIVVETTDEKIQETLTNKMFLIRDRANEIVVTKTEEELREEKGQTLLKEKIKKDLMEIFETDKITNVYFNDFIIQ